MYRLTQLATVSLLSLYLAGCARNEAAPAPPPAPQVSVATVVTKPVSEFDEFTGRIEAVQRVEIRPRVTGYISSVEFVEGREVRKDDVLFVIDPRPYEAELKRTQAELARATTTAALARTEHERATKLLNLRAISQEEFDSRVAGNKQADADVQAAQAAVEAAQLNLTYTRVRAPISGLISKAEVTVGNLVNSGQTVLTNLVSMDPVYVEFQGDEQMYLKYAASTRKQSQAAGRPVWVGLANEEGYPHQGVMVFLDNQLNAATGSVNARGRLNNAERHYTPGMFARVRLSDGEQKEAVLIKDSAIGTDQNVRFVYVVDTNHKVEYRAVKLGPMVDGLRVVREGLAEGETIVVNGLQRVQPGATVTPQSVAMEPAAKSAALLASTQSPKAGAAL